MTRWGALMLLALSSMGCREAEPRDQWLVTFATDAPLPQFGDRLLVEVLRDGALACSGCRRIFGVEPEQLPGSFGIAAPEGGTEGLRLRMRLYRNDHTGPDGSPEGNAHLDVLAQLPPPSGSTPVSVVARMDCFGVIADLTDDLSCDPSSGTLAPVAVLEEAAVVPAVGSWSEAVAVPCEGGVPDDMVCIEGGAFLFGSPLHFNLNAELASEPEYLVRLSAFALDREEVTVGEVRQLIVDGLVSGSPVMPDPDPLGAGATCSYLGPNDPSNDVQPVNCVSHEVAEEICAALGRQLPTEAQWEFAAGQRSLETPYPWGYDDDVCDHAIVARGRFNEAYVEETITCRKLDDGTLGPWGYLPEGHERDVTAEGVTNLGGNMAEWVADNFRPYTDNCFGADGLVVDPVCDAPEPLHVFRGSGWNGLPAHAQTFIRNRASSASTNLGFRCALPR